MRRIIGLLVIIAALCAALSGCGKKAQQAQEGAPSDSLLGSGTPRDGGTVIRRLDSECKTLNWVLYTTAYELFVLRHLYDPILDYDVNGNLVPVLASELPVVSTDHLRITVKLRTDAHWQDGLPITAKDVKFTLDKIRDPKIPALNKAPYFEKLDHLEVVDDHTVTFVRLTYPGALHELIARFAPTQSEKRAAGTNVSAFKPRVAAPAPGPEPAPSAPGRRTGRPAAAQRRQ